MVLDLEQIPNPETNGFDVCVIGAGAAGIAIVVELLNYGKRVLLLESGGLRYEADTQLLYEGESVGLPYQGMNAGRARVFGGTTTEWGGQILQIDDAIFEPRCWVPGSGWPFSKSVLEPFYSRALRLEGLDEDGASVNEIWGTLGLAPPNFGETLISEFSRWCPTTDFTRLHGHVLEQHSSVVVYLHANACELMFGEDGLTVQAVRCRTLSGRETRFYAANFVLCLGAIESSRFLLQPVENGSIPTWNRNGLVGRYYQDHIACFAADVEDLTLQPAEAYFDYVSIARRRYHPKMKLAPDVQRERKTLDACGTIAFLNNGEEELAQAFATYRLLKRRRAQEVGVGQMLQLIKMLPRLLWHKFPYSRRAAGRLGSDNISLKLCVHCEQSPFSASRVTLAPRRDALGMFRAKLDWRISDHELSTIGAYVDIVSKVFERKQLGRIIPDPRLFHGGEQLMAVCRESSHHIGGTRIGLSPTEGVVDLDLRVFGTRNAFVCSTSVFPCAGFANPTHTLLALAVRLAEHLSGRPQSEKRSN